MRFVAFLPTRQLRPSDFFLVARRPITFFEAAMRDTIPSPQVQQDAEGPSLYPLVQELVNSLQRRHADTGVPLPQLTVDVPPGHGLPGDAEIVRNLLEEWLASAVRAAAGSAAMARSAEVVITSVQYADRLEVEIADTGPAIARRQIAGEAVAGRLRTAAEQSLLDRLQATVRLDDCPEGGVALTLCLPRQVMRRAAA